MECWDQANVAQLRRTQFMGESVRYFHDIFPEPLDAGDFCLWDWRAGRTSRIQG
jgi:hypothetical protein